MIEHILFNISYVGGYEQVIRLTEQFYSIQPFTRRQVQAFPDADFQDSWNDLITKPNKTPGEQDLLNTINRNRSNITILDITPEKDVWEWLVKNPALFEQRIEQLHGNQMFSLANIVNQVVAEEINTSPNNVRKHAKFCFKNLSDKLVQFIPGTSVESWYEQLISCFVADKLSNQNVFDNWKQFFKSIINRQ